ncbi:tubulin delta chain-like [Rhynchophorus ferrugineus]|uniref:tubulin delta chain-like n=1 Tax=Rhynchophorus ferrugineus TaxID=354439 RepID=UPI003FCE3934
MSLITLQFGQCGNQIGQSLYTAIENDIQKKNDQQSNYNVEAINKWFNVTQKGVWEPRSILVDTETKVIENFNSTNIKFNNIIAKSCGGSANNWAFGYSENSRLVMSEVLDSVCGEFEKSDFVSSLLNLYSLSGGTGSGVGSSVIEKLRDEYPKKCIINCAILPYMKGEVSTQAYNTLLNLAHLYSLSNSIFLFENDKLLYMCKYNLGLTDVSFADLNLLISQQLGSIFQPVTNFPNIPVFSSLTAHPSYKFLQIKTEPNFIKENDKFEGQQQWSALINALTKQSRYELQYFKCNKSIFKPKIIGNVLITRSQDSLLADSLKPLKHLRDFVSWLPKEEQFKSYHTNQKYLNYQKYLSMIYNSSNIFMPLNNIVEDAWIAFTHRAYLHHYKNYNIDEDWFLNSFQILENILNNYKNM